MGKKYEEEDFLKAFRLVHPEITKEEIFEAKEFTEKYIMPLQNKLHEILTLRPEKFPSFCSSAIFNILITCPNQYMAKKILATIIHTMMSSHNVLKNAENNYKLLSDLMERLKKEREEREKNV